MYIRIFIALTLILSTGYVAHSQEEPTPAPTKTETPEIQDVTEDEEIEALTQEDLIVFNGNVQVIVGKLTDFSHIHTSSPPTQK